MRGATDLPTETQEEGLLARDRGSLLVKVCGMAEPEALLPPYFSDAWFGSLTQPVNLSITRGKLEK